MKYIYRLILIVVIFSVVGCISIDRDYPNVNKYKLEPIYSNNDLYMNEKVNLVIGDIKVNPTYKGKAFVFKIGKFVYKNDYYNQFLFFPNIMLKEMLENWFSNSSNINIIQYRQNSTEYMLNLSLDELFCDISDKDMPKVIVAMSIIVIDTNKSKEAQIIFQNKYREILKLNQLSILNILDKWNICFEHIFKQLEVDLSKV